MGQTPLQRKKLRDCVERNIALGGNEAAETCNTLPTIVAKEHYATLKKLFGDLENRYPKKVHFINVLDELCQKNRCLLSRNGQLLYRDHNHLSNYGSTIILDKALLRITETGYYALRACKSLDCAAFPYFPNV